MNELNETQHEVPIKEQSNKRITETEEERAERLEKQEEIDKRSVYVGNVDYQSTPQQLETFFKSAGSIERITILFDKNTGLPKGYAYVEFLKAESVEKAIRDLHGKIFKGRELRVTTKRTNLPGFGKRGNFRGRGRGGRGISYGRRKKRFRDDNSNEHKNSNNFGENAKEKENPETSD